MIFGQALFRNDSLDGYLRAQVDAIDNHVRSNVSKSDLVKSDDEIVAKLLPEARVDRLDVDFDHPQKDAQEARVQVNDPFSGVVTIDGVRATRSYSFKGDPALFSLRTNPFTSVLPHGEIRNGRVVVGLEGRNDAETLKQEIDRQERTLREYVGYSQKQVDEHNARLSTLLAEAVARRRKALADIDDLRNKI